MKEPESCQQSRSPGRGAMLVGDLGYQACSALWTGTVSQLSWTTSAQVLLRAGICRFLFSTVLGTEGTVSNLEGSCSPTLRVAKCI